MAFEQVTALGELTVRWTGADSGDLAISDEFDSSTDETPTRLPTRPPTRTPPYDRTRAAAPERRGPCSAAAISGALEALLLLADEPMSELTLAEAVGAPEAVTVEALEALATFYDETGRGFELRRRVGGGWRYWTRVEHADVIAAHVVAGQSARLSQAALETLAVIAYQQPVSRGRVAADPRGERRRRDPDAARPRPGRGGGPRRRHRRGRLRAPPGSSWRRWAWSASTTCPPLAPHLPEVDELEAELSALAAPVAERAEPSPSQPRPSHGPTGQRPQPDRRRPAHRAGRGGEGMSPRKQGGERRRGAGGPAAAEGAGPGGSRLAPGVGDHDRPGTGRGERARRHRAGPPRRPRARRDPRRRLPHPAAPAAPLHRAQQAARRRLHAARPRGPADARGRRRRVRGEPRAAQGAAVPRRPARHRHRGPDHPHQRRRLRPQAVAPELRDRQDLPRRGRGHRQRP